MRLFYSNNVSNDNTVIIFESCLNCVYDNGVESVMVFCSFIMTSSFVNSNLSTVLKLTFLPIELT